MTLFQVIGCVVLGLGIYALVDGASLVTLVDKSGVGDDMNITAFTSAAYIFIVVAVFVVVLTFFGCFGAIKESKCMLGTYFILILVMFVVMIAGAVLGYSTSMDKLQGALEKTMPQFKDGATNHTQMAITKAWSEVQTRVSAFVLHIFETSVEAIKESSKNQNFHFDLQVPPTLLNGTHLHCQMNGFISIRVQNFSNVE